MFPDFGNVNQVPLQEATSVVRDRRDLDSDVSPKPLNPKPQTLNGPSTTCLQHQTADGDILRQGSVAP